MARHIGITGLSIRNRVGLLSIRAKSNSLVSPLRNGLIDHWQARGGASQRVPSRYPLLPPLERPAQSPVV
jgi:hypothetical protein